MKKILQFSVEVFIFISISIVVSAKSVSVGHIVLDVNSPWTCSLEGSELVCLKNAEAGKPPSRDHLIVIATRTKTDQDNLKDFARHLKVAKTYTGPDGVTYKAKIKYVKELRLADRKWVDSEQEQSEVPGFTTRYLATLIGPTVVIATFSSKKELFEEFNREVPKIASTIKLKPN